MAHELDDPADVQWMLRQPQYRRLYDLSALELSLARRPHRVLNELLRDLAPTASPLETAFLTKVIRRHGLPEPECQVKLEGFTVDFYWPEYRLIVEVDGHNHALPAMQQADAVRDNRLLLAEYLSALRPGGHPPPRRDRPPARHRDDWQIRHPIDPQLPAAQTRGEAGKSRRGCRGARRSGR